MKILRILVALGAVALTTPLIHATKDALIPEKDLTPKSQDSRIPASGISSSNPKYAKIILSLTHGILSLCTNSARNVNNKMHVATDLVRLVKDLWFTSGVNISVVLDVARLVSHAANEPTERHNRSFLTGCTHVVLLPVAECLLDMDVITQNSHYLAALADAIGFKEEQNASVEEQVKQFYRRLQTLIRLADACIDTQYNRIAVAWLSLHLYALFIATEQGRACRQPVKDAINNLKQKVDDAFAGDGQAVGEVAT